MLKPAESIIFFEIPLIYAQFFGVLMLKHFQATSAEDIPKNKEETLLELPAFGLFNESMEPSFRQKPSSIHIKM